MYKPELTPVQWVGLGAAGAGVVLLGAGCSSPKENTVHADTAPSVVTVTDPPYTYPSPTDTVDASPTDTPSTGPTAMPSLEVTPSASARPSYPAVGRVPLNATNYCLWTPDNPQPLVKTSPRTVQLDGRCSPEHKEGAEPITDTASGAVVLHNRPESGFMSTLGRVPDGTLAKVICVTPGEEVTDRNSTADHGGTKTATWIAVEVDNKTGNGVTGKGLVDGASTGYSDIIRVPICSKAQLDEIAARH